MSIPRQIKDRLRLPFILRFATRQRRSLLYIVLAVSRAFTWRAKRSPGKDLSWGQGVSIIIPERGRPDLLKRCLLTLKKALQAFPEPFEVIIVVNGTDPKEYDLLRNIISEAQWEFEPQPLGFTTAIHRGLSLARFAGVYLLNNDMELEDQTLTSLLPWRGPRIFAVASEILFGKGRREETGWTDLSVSDGIVSPTHIEPIADWPCRGAVYAGAGSSLFHRQTLKKIIQLPDPYHPFYWEDVDWSVSAWHRGYEVIVCPRSKITHGHQETVKTFYREKEVARIVRRNQLMYFLRHPFPVVPGKVERGHIMEMDGRSLAELVTFGQLRNLMVARLNHYRHPFQSMDCTRIAPKVYTAPHSNKPKVIVVSPFGVIPASHGGARRTVELARALSSHYEVHLLSDEESTYDWIDQDEDLGVFTSIHFCTPRLDSGVDERNERMTSHAHLGLAQELNRLIAVLRPVAVQLEHLEIAGLVSHIPKTCKRILIAHDVLLGTGTDPGDRTADRKEVSLYRQFDAVIACGREDAALTGTSTFVIPNAVTVPRYQPSNNNRRIVFVGPFRSTVNFSGIRWFLNRVFPRVHAQHGDVELLIIGGNDFEKKIEGFPEFRNKSVTLIEYDDDLSAIFRSCAITINPVPTLRGTSLKVVESLAHGRVCVASQSGARGYTDLGIQSLVVADDAEDWVRKINHLLSDNKERMSLEAPGLDFTEQTLSWQAAGDSLLAAYEKTLQKGVGS